MAISPTPASQDPARELSALGELPRHVLDSLREGCQVIGFDWTYLYLNDAAAAQGRKAKGDLLGRTMMEAYPGIDRTPMFEVLRDSMEQRVHRWMENPFTYADGTTRWFELRFVPVPEGVFILSLDVTERKDTEVERRWLALAISESAEAVVITDRDGAIQFVNPAFERITGYARADVLGRNPRFLKSGKQDQAFYRAMWDVLTAGRTWHGRVTNRRKDGTLYTQDTSISPIHDASGTVVSYVAVNRDMTHELGLEAQLQQAQRLETLGRLAGGIAHDFNNLLSVIISYADMNLDKVPSDSRLHADLVEIRDAGENAAKLTRQLLAFSRRQLLQPEVLNLNTVVQRMETMLRRLIGEDVELSVTLAPDLGNVKADPGQLEQVIMNLAVNSRDAMPTGGRLSLATGNVDLDEGYTSRHGTVTPGPYVMLSVSDTGTGMDEHTLERLFEPFFTTKEVGRGTGLGLAMVYGIVKQSGGLVWVYSEPGHGTVFKVYLPREPGEVTVRPQPERAVPRTARGETVLLVEDDFSVRGVAERILSDAGYKVLTAARGGEALDVHAGHRGSIQLLLTDVVMPGISGRVLAERLLAVQPDLRVLFMSGYTDDETLHRDVRAGGTAFISKPLNAADLVRRVRAMLDD